MRPTGISIGDFNFRVTFYTQGKGAVNVYGEPTLTLGAAVDRWANVAFKNGKISNIETGAEYPEFFEIKVRKPLNVTVGDRVDFDGRELAIISVSDSDKVHLTIKAVAINE